VCVDAGNTKHEDGGGDENDVEAGESDEDAVDRVLHLGPEHQVCLITAGSGPIPSCRKPGLRIHDIFVWIRMRIRGSIPLMNGPNPDSDPFATPDPSIFIIDLQDANKKQI